MRPLLKILDTNDYRTWAEFEAAEIADPYDHFGWFTIEIGDAETPGCDRYQVVVSTPVAIPRAKRSAERLPTGQAKFRGVVVPVFEPALVKETLLDLVAGISGNRWEDIRAEMMKSMYWEYE